VNSSSIWQTLGIDRTQDRSEIRRAYARQLKTTNPEDHAAAFQRLRAAYEQALAYAGQRVSALRAEADNPGRDTGTAGQGLQQASGRGVLPPDPKAQHVAACQRLAALVASSSPVERAALVQALESVLSSPAFHDVGIQVETERWLAPLILFNQPRSDPLLETAIARFDWSASAIDRKDMPVIRALLQRRDDLAFLSEIARPESVHHRAFEALSRPPTGQTVLRRLFGPDPSQAVRELLAAIRASHPTAIGGLDEAAVAAWEGYLSRPRLSSWGLWAVLCSPVALALVEVARRLARPDYVSMADPHLLLVCLPLLLVPCLAVAALIRLYGIAWPRFYWDRSSGSRASIWLGIGWAPSALILLAVAAALPPVPAAMPVIVVLAALVVLWVLITARRDGAPSPFRLMFREVLLVIWWVSLRSKFDTEQYIQMSAALVAGIAAGAFGAGSLLELWFVRVQGRVRRLAPLALILLAAGAGGLLWLAYRQPWLSPLAAAVVAAVDLTSRVPSLALGPRATKFYFYSMYYPGAVIVIIVIGDSRAPLAVGGVWLLTGVAVAAGLLLASRRGS
jgi:hypothetical protein